MSKKHKKRKIRLDLRDELSEERTELANQRTLLAFVRTFLTMVVVGVSLLKFFNAYFAHLLGWGLIIVAIATLIVGSYDYLKTKKLIKIFEKKFT